MSDDDIPVDLEPGSESAASPALGPGGGANVNQGGAGPARPVEGPGAEPVEPEDPEAPSGTLPGGEPG